MARETEEKQPRILSGLWICIWALLVLILILIFLVLVIVIFVMVLDAKDDLKRDSRNLSRHLDERVARFDQLVAQMEDTAAAIDTHTSQRLSGPFSRRLAVSTEAFSSCQSQALAVDVNGDGQKDLVCQATTNINPESDFYVHLSDKGRFESEQFVDTVERACGMDLVVMDFNGDGLDDLLCQTPGRSELTVEVYSFQAGDEYRDHSSFTIGFGLNADHACHSGDRHLRAAGSRDLICIQYEEDNSVYSNISMSWYVDEEEAFFTESARLCPDSSQKPLVFTGWAVSHSEEPVVVLMCLGSEEEDTAEEKVEVPLLVAQLEGGNVTFYPNATASLPPCEGSFMKAQLNFDAHEDLICFSAARIYYSALFVGMEGAEESPQFEIIRPAGDGTLGCSLEDAVMGDFDGDLLVDIACVGTNNIVSYS